MIYIFLFNMYLIILLSFHYCIIYIYNFSKYYLKEFYFILYILYIYFLFIFFIYLVIN
ncbi:hypothetical protein H8356DRAFT_376630 [Neocallimastix lanati (nom. inval.)]|nr:hypothetical protein H8356DRAFT_376630 [Neocallimastix sp. JGI-2020a]